MQHHFRYIRYMFSSHIKLCDCLMHPDSHKSLIPKTYRCTYIEMYACACNRKVNTQGLCPHTSLFHCLLSFYPTLLVSSLLYLLLNIELSSEKWWISSLRATELKNKAHTLVLFCTLETGTVLSIWAFPKMLIGWIQVFLGHTYVPWFKHPDN